MPSLYSLCWKRVNETRCTIILVVAVLMILSFLYILQFEDLPPTEMSKKIIFSKMENLFWVTKVECCSASYWDMLLDSDSLTGLQLMHYIMWSNSSSCQLAHEFGGRMLQRPSGIAGQKAVCIDTKIAPEPSKCTVYSFGINNEWSFDEEMESYGCEVFAFDPSMGLDHHNHTSGIHFYNWGLGDRDEYDYGLNWTIRSLSSIYETLSALYGHKIIDYVKIDIEYSEWIALPDIIKSGILSKVRQLGMEIHFDSTASLEQYRKWAKLLRAIEKSGMIRFKSQYNPWFLGNFSKFGFHGSFGHEIAWYNNILLNIV